MQLRLFIIGQKWFGEQTLGAMRDLEHEVVGVCAPTGSDRLWRSAADLGIPIVPSGGLSAESIPDGVDLIVCAHAHCFVPGAVRHRARLGAIGYHPSFLPRHRGRDAVRWAIHMREAYTGGSVYWMSDVADAGPLAAREAVLIPPGADVQWLWRERLAPLGLRLLRDVVTDISKGRIIRTPQEEPCATWEPGFARPTLRKSKIRHEDIVNTERGEIRVVKEEPCNPP